MTSNLSKWLVPFVAPLAGAWIEIDARRSNSSTDIVAPLAGAWIEIFSSTNLSISQLSRTPRGCVD